MKNDLRPVIKKVAAFLGKDRNEEEVAKLVEHLSFQSMKKNPSVNLEAEERMIREIFKNGTENEHFFRSGKVGSYKAEMSPKQIWQFNEKNAQYLSDQGIDFSY